MRLLVLGILLGLALDAGARTNADPEVAGEVAEEATAEAKGQATSEATGEATTGAEEAGPLEKTRATLRTTTESIARGIDSWFGDKPFAGRGRVSDGRIGLRTTWREDEGFDLVPRFNARIDLPNLRERAFVYLGRDNEREVLTDQPSAFSRQEKLLSERVREDQSFFAGVGLALQDALELRLGIHRGYRLYVQARYGRDWPLSENDRAQFRETLFWTLVDGFGSTTAFSAEHSFSPALVLRWLNAATLSEKTDGVAWSSSLGLHRGFGGEAVLSAELLINGETGRNVAVSDYGVRTKWQQPVYRDWLLGEFIVGYFWPRKDAATPRGRTWAFGLGAQMYF